MVTNPYCKHGLLTNDCVECLRAEIARLKEKVDVSLRELQLINENKALREKVERLNNKIENALQYINGPFFLERPTMVKQILTREDK